MLVCLLARMIVGCVFKRVLVDVFVRTGVLVQKFVIGRDETIRCMIQSECSGWINMIVSMT